MFALRCATALLSIAVSSCAPRTPPPTESPNGFRSTLSTARACPATTPIGRPDAGWKERHQAILVSVLGGGHRVAFLGDSITQGWEDPGKGVWGDRIASVHAVNCGISADRTQHVLFRLDNGLMDALRGAGNDIRCVVLLIGTNNTSPPADSAADIAAGVEAIVARLREGLPSARTVLVDIFPRGVVHNAQREVIDDVNSRLAALSSDGSGRVLRLKLRNEFVGAAGEIPASLMPDGLHLSDEGYRLWADRLAPLIDEALR